MGIATAITKAAPNGAQVVSEDRGGWRRLIFEPFSGAFQRDIEWTTDTVLAYHAVYACITLIASDVGKLRPKLVQKDDDGIWSEIESSAFSPVLTKPNRYQNHIQFKEWWITSKLIRVNTYALKQRDRRGVVVALYLLDPSRVQVLVAPDGSVFYRLSKDNLSGLETETIDVPASEIIHDRMNCLFHPLVGTSPIFASGMAANLGLKVQSGSSTFFGKGALPSGILSAPGKIPQDTADRLKDHWQTQFSGDNAGAVAVLGDGLTFEQMRMSSVDAQLIEQLKWTAETVCSTFHVPPFKAGIGAMPTYQNAEILNGIYYSDCLQSHIESWELVMDEGLGIGVGDKVEGKTMGVELDLDALLRMDTATQVKTLVEGVGGGIYAPDEARQKLDLKPVKGGATPYMQQQNFSLAALDERDKKNPLANPAPPTPPATPPEPPRPAAEDENAKAAERALLAFKISKGLRAA